MAHTKTDGNKVPAILAAKIELKKACEDYILSDDAETSVRGLWNIEKAMKKLVDLRGWQVKGD